MQNIEVSETEQVEVEQSGIGSDDYPTGMLANPSRVRN